MVEDVELECYFVIDNFQNYGLIMLDLLELFLIVFLLGLIIERYLCFIFRDFGIFYWLNQLFFYVIAYFIKYFFQDCLNY